MGDFYLSGLAVAFLINLVKIFISTSALLSQRARNLKKIGLHYSCIQGNYQGSPFRVWKFGIYLLYMLIITPLFSWLTVVSAAWGVIAWLTNRAPTPERIKEIQFKIATMNLNKEQLIELQVEINKILGVLEPVLTGETNEDVVEEEEDKHSLITDDAGWYREVNVDPQKKTFSFYCHTPDYSCIYNYLFEYRFDDGVMMSRLLEYSTDQYGKVEYDVKDNVVLESEIRKRYGEDSIHIDSLEEKLLKWKNDVAWSKHEAYDVTYFVMSKHPDIFPTNEFKRIVRQDLERLRTGADQILAKARALKAIIKESDGGFDLRQPVKCSSEMKKALDEAFAEDKFAQLNITSSELSNLKSYEVTLLKWLDELPYRRFWASLLKKAKKLTKLHSSAEPAEKHRIGVESPKIGILYNYTLGRHQASVELYIDGGEDSDDENTQIHKHLSQHKESIERIFGDPLEWENESYQRFRTIKNTITLGGYMDESSWPQIQDAMIEKMIKLEKAFSPYVAKLNTGPQTISKG